MLRDDNVKVRFVVVPEIHVTPGLVMDVKASFCNARINLLEVILGSLGMHTHFEKRFDPMEAEIYHMKKMRNESPPSKRQARMFSRGRITLPREVCLNMGLGSGDKLEFETDGDGFLIRPVKPRSSTRSSTIRSQ